MKNINAYKNFLAGRYLDEGIRITTGVLLPVFILAYAGLLDVGVVLSLGALCVSVADHPGPVHHRRNGMLFCVIIITLLAIITGFAASSDFLLGACILIVGFLFSMLAVYGIRLASIGIAAIIVMILGLQNPAQGKAIWDNALFIFIGGLWYMSFSLLLYRIRPYKIIQQIMGDFVIDISQYLDTRAIFYTNDPAYDKAYQLLLHQQVVVQSQQSLLSDLLFKTRTIVKESTHTSRVLLKIYVDIAELFESIMTTFQDYRILHKQFDDTGILEEFSLHIKALASELSEIGLAIKSARPSVVDERNTVNIQKLRAHFDMLRLNIMSNANVDHFISLGRVMNNLHHLTEKINVLHHYTSYDTKIKKPSKELIDYSNYAEPEDIRPAIFFNNLNFKSNIFRHAIRVGLALLAGYLVALFFNIGHSYWILLTIVVILKPAYSLTKKRNTDRLVGTFLGILLGVFLLTFIKDSRLLILIMIACMVAAYAFMRTRYFISVLFLTPYLVIFFHLLYPSTIETVLRDRLLDTFIGSGIAFVASMFLVPAWEQQTIKSYMAKMLDANAAYYAIIAIAFSGSREIPKQEFKTARRDVLTNLANLSDAFNRMLSEPKRYQEGIEFIHRFVVLNHILISHFATLSYYFNVRLNRFRSADLLPVIKNTQLYLSNATHWLESTGGTTAEPDKGALAKLNEHANVLMLKRKEEISRGQLETDTKKSLVEVKSVIDQFNYIHGIAADISKNCKELARFA